MCCGGKKGEKQPDAAPLADPGNETPPPAPEDPAAAPSAPTTEEQQKGTASKMSDSKMAAVQPSLVLSSPGKGGGTMAKKDKSVAQSMGPGGAGAKSFGLMSNAKGPNAQGASQVMKGTKSTKKA